jgi:hypothetical protein
MAKSKTNLFLNRYRKFEPIYKEYRLLSQKIPLRSQKYGFGIRDPEKIYSGSRDQKGNGSRIRNTAFNIPPGRRRYLFQSFNDLYLVLLLSFSPRAKGLRAHGVE